MADEINEIHHRALRRLGGEAYIPGELMAKHLAITPATLRIWVKKGMIEKHCYLKIKSTYRFRPDATIDSLQRWSDQQQHQEQAGQMTEQLELPFEENNL